MGGKQQQEKKMKSKKIKKSSFPVYQIKEKENKK
jgi:hypothetical protein